MASLVAAQVFSGQVASSMVSVKFLTDLACDFVGLGRCMSRQSTVVIRRDVVICSLYLETNKKASKQADREREREGQVASLAQGRLKLGVGKGQKP